jgi:hypothetical protein
MNQSDFGKQLNDDAVLDMRANRLAALANHIKAESPTSQLKESLNCLQEGIDYLRMVIKYQAFDLEATRRENAELKAILEEYN